MLQTSEIAGPGAFKICRTNGKLVISCHSAQRDHEVGLAVPPDNIGVKFELLYKTIFIGCNKFKPASLALPEKQNIYFFPGAVLSEISKAQVGTVIRTDISSLVISQFAVTGSH